MLELPMACRTLGKKIKNGLKIECINKILPLANRQVTETDDTDQIPSADTEL
jgi:hypothetical protein